MSRRDFARIAAALLGFTLLLNLVWILYCGDGLSPMDPYSEAGVVRAGERFAREGFLENFGLPDVTYGDRFPGEGMTGPSGSRPSDPIYHGYPPGSEWLGGLYSRWFGAGRVALFRVFPVAFALLASATFLAGLTWAVGRSQACWVYLACLLTPMFTAMSHVLHYQGYALSLLLIELAILMNLLSPSGPGRARAGTLAALFLLGFLQGYLCYDYCFVTTFAAVPIALLIVPDDRAIPWKSILALCVAAGLGFVMAHGLHFTQSLLYFGDLRSALEEYAFRSKKEYAARSLLEGRSTIEGILIGVRYYARAYLRWNQLFGVAGEVLVAGLIWVLVVSQATFGAGRWQFQATMTRPRARELAGLAAALAIGLGWLFVKRYHALNHLNYIGRHLFLFHLSGCLIVARAIAIHPRAPIPSVAAPVSRAGVDRDSSESQEKSAHGHQSKPKVLV